MDESAVSRVQRKRSGTFLEVNLTPAKDRYDKSSCRTVTPFLIIDNGFPFSEVRSYHVFVRFYLFFSFLFQHPFPPKRTLKCCFCRIITDNHKLIQLKTDT